MAGGIGAIAGGVSGGTATVALSLASAAIWGTSDFVGGIATLMGRNWGRWLATAWISFHVILSMFRSWQMVAVHALLLVFFAYALFRAESTQFFRARTSPPDV